MSPSEQAHGGFDKAISSMDTVPFIINGEDVTSTSTFPVTNPFDAKKLWDGSAASVSDALGAVEAAQAAFASWSQTKPSFRRDILFRAADLFISRKEELFRYQSEETGAGRQFMEINLNATVQILKDIGGRIEAAVEGSVPTTVEEGSHAIIVKEPYGVVLAIAPWYVNMANKRLRRTYKPPLQECSLRARRAISRICSRDRQYDRPQGF